MKKYINIFFALMAAALLLTACEKESGGIDNTNYGPLKVTKVFQHNVKAIKELDPAEGARLGTMIRLEGENFLGIRAITVNGSPANINPNLLTPTTVIFRIPSVDKNNVDTPTGDECPEEFRDKIVITSNGNDDYTFNFHVMGSAPSISGFSHTLPNIGAWVTIYGNSLKGVKSVTLYNDLDEPVAESTAIRNEDPKGKSFQFKMPEVVLWSEVDAATSGNFDTCYEGGYVIVNTDNGKAASANNFYRQKNIFLNNFYSQSDAAWGRDLYTYNPDATNTGYYGWGSGVSGDLPDSENYPAYDSDIAAISLTDGPKAPVKFRSMPEMGTKIPVIALNDGEHSYDGGACIARACFNSDACTGRAVGMAQNLSSGVELFSNATSTDKLAFEFDYFIPRKWDSGRIAVTFVDNGLKWMTHFHPWTTDPDTYKDGMKEWRTATIPLSDFPAFVGETYSFLLKNTIKGVNGEYACQGMIAFYNDECDGHAAHEYSAEDKFVIYWNNLRIVPIEQIELDEDE